MNRKSQGMQFFLTLVFGPLGLLYSRPGMVIPFIVGAFAAIAVAAMAKLGGGFGALLLLCIYIAQFVIGYGAVEKHNSRLSTAETGKRETEERRHKELVAATAGSKPAGESKTCPFCAETILKAAVKCKHCGSDLAAA